MSRELSGLLVDLLQLDRETLFQLRFESNQFPSEVPIDSFHGLTGEIVDLLAHLLRGLSDDVRNNLL